MKKVKELKTIEEVKIFSDPYRMKILECIEKCGKPVTVKQIGIAMEEKPSKVHYHVQKLLKIDILELHHTETINGIIAKYYVPTAEEFSVSLNSNEKKALGKSEIQQMLSNFFKQAEESFVSQIIKSEEYKKKHGLDDLPEKKRSNGILLAESLYMDEEEQLKVKKQLQEIFQKYSKKQNENQVKVETFFAYMEEFTED